MLKSVTQPERAGWAAPAVAIVLAITAFRVCLLAFNRMDLFVDEAQYWLWGQELAFGYYSKPPMIGWVIRFFTDLAGSDAPFWVRLPAPLFHGATALILGSIAAHVFGRRAGILVAAGFATLPMVALSSILISTDTIMFPFLALALAGYLRLLEKSAPWWAVLTGAAVGLAFLSKYAAIYYLICAPIAAALIPQARPRLRDILIALVAFLVVISPNIIWNVLNGFTTVEHTLDNADWVRDPSQKAGLSLAKLSEFLISQFAVFGPVLFGALIWQSLRARKQSDARQFLLIFTLPILAVVCVQALLSGAYANWAAAAYLAGTVTVIPWMTPRWLVASFVVNGALSLALPIIGVFAETPATQDSAALKRYTGRDEMSLQIIETALRTGTTDVVAQNRDILADLFYTGRDSGLSFYALPTTGRAAHHYALKYPLPDETAGPVLYIADSRRPPVCQPDAQPVTTISPTSGTYGGKTKRLYLVPGDCWAAP
ncbi:ArnT family glycosyltransferase [Actibacterium lipolyticum]|uniref:Dolichyl-phosphate-mannose-protein mannosyltransferase n=1 Tax=Actibacterium lipolyticum TaxID=1524263 RepID=A0A238KUL8_9RHOB|nr:glycosyltransferase family 39 protein [Actibacterium lipolyticum]SMX46407.1 Dolichyl-phosphate-mannose-protein mannosyltransferase [Actibacterium lipolyticum]